MNRTDTHSPKNFDPAEYEEVGYFDNHAEDGGVWMSRDLDESLVEPFEGNYATRGRCDHCGAGPLRYGVVFLHGPSNELVVTGTTCADTLNLSSKSDVERRANLEYARILKAIERWRAESADNDKAAAICFATQQAETDYRDALQRYNDEGNVGRRPEPVKVNDFIYDVARKLRRYGSLSERQVAAVIKSDERDREFAAKRESQPQPTTPLEEGKRLLTGTVVSTKWQESDFGGSLKMLVVLDDLNKVWGTVPRSLEDETFARVNDDNTVVEGRDLKGSKVSFSATVERSRDDEHFGFYKRPTKAVFVD